MTRTFRSLGSLLAASALCASCASMSESPLTSWIPSIPAPSFAWLTGGGKKVGDLPKLNASVTPRIKWQQSVGRAGPGVAPAVTPSAIYAAATDGTLVRLDPATGNVVWRISVGSKISAGPGAGDTLVAVGTDKGDVLAFDTNGKALWTAHVSSEVIAPPSIAEK